MVWESVEVSRNESAIQDKRTVKTESLVLRSDRACFVWRSKERMIETRAEVERYSASVSEVLGSSGIRDMRPKNWMYKDRLIG